MPRFLCSSLLDTHGKAGHYNSCVTELSPSQESCTNHRLVIQLKRNWSEGLGEPRFPSL